MRISDWSSDVCSSDLRTPGPGVEPFAPTFDTVGVFGLDLRQVLQAALATIGETAQPRGDGAGSGSLSIAWLEDDYFTSIRSEEHTSELQSLMRISYAVFCLKKKKTNRL